MARSREYFEQAIALDPDFAEAHADLGGYYLNLWTAGRQGNRPSDPRPGAQSGGRRLLCRACSVGCGRCRL